MGEAEVGAGGRSLRTWSLRREWSRAFVIFLFLLLVAALASILGVHLVIDEVQGTAEELRREATIVAELRTAMVEHEQAAQHLLNKDAVDRVAFVRQQNALAHRFDEAAAVFPEDDGIRAGLIAVRDSWRKGLQDYGLWEQQALGLRGDHASDTRFFAASSAATRARLEALQEPSLVAMQRGLARGVLLERALIVGLVAVFGVALAVTVYFRRRMARDLTRPVADLHRGVLEIKSGRYDRPIGVARRDELGELAEAVNEMASTLEEQHRALSRRASHDTLTGLANRATLVERLESSFGPGSDRRTQTESLLFIDIDDFKNVNDTLGHEGGDDLLIELARRLGTCVRAYDLVARLGGDEFAVVVLEEPAGGTAVEVAERILAALAEPFAIGGTRMHVAASIGVARRRPETADAAELLRHADFAMYMAKGAGKNRYQLFDAQMHEDMVEATALKHDLASAVGQGELRLDYQPVVDLRTGAVVGVEALVRWQHPTLGLLAPADFVPLAEETGDIGAIGAWVLRTAAHQTAGWRRDVPGHQELWVSVNVSALQLPRAAGPDGLEAILRDPATQAPHVLLEVTESALATDVAGAVAALEALKATGARIAVDDFGTGYSSLSTLARLPADVVKIDRAFVSGPAASTASAGPMLEAVLGMADKLSLDVVAEGVETPEQCDLLRRLGYRYAQGYLFGRPVDADDLAALLAAGPVGQNAFA